MQAVHWSVTSKIAGEPLPSGVPGKLAFTQPRRAAQLMLRKVIRQCPEVTGTSEFVVDPHKSTLASRNRQGRLAGDDITGGMQRRVEDLSQRIEERVPAVARR